MSLDDLVEAELARHDWRALRQAAGTAEHVPNALRQLLSSASPDDVQRAYWRLENHVVVQGQLFDSAIAVTHVVMAALVSSTRPRWVRIGLLELLFQITAGEAHEAEVARGAGGLGDECRRAARCGLWLLYRELAGEDPEGAREVLKHVEDQPDRLKEVERRMGFAP